MVWSLVVLDFCFWFEFLFLFLFGWEVGECIHKCRCACRPERALNPKNRNGCEPSVGTGNLMQKHQALNHQVISPAPFKNYTNLLGGGGGGRCHGHM